jgi:hypothetical protein
MPLRGAQSGPRRDGAVCSGVPLEELSGHGRVERDAGAARNRLIYEAHIHYGYSLSAIGRALGLHYTTISKVVKTCTTAATIVESEALREQG